MFAAVMTYVGAVIGAGFASGKEINEFFASANGYMYIIIAFLLFSVINYVLMNGFCRNRIYCYTDMCKKYFKRYNGAVCWITGLYSLLSFGIMCSGARTALDGKNTVFYLLFNVAAVTVCCFELKGVKALNAVLTPMMIVGLAFLCIRKTPVFAAETVNSVKYVSYNLFMCLPVLCEISKSMRNRRSILIFTLLTGTIVFGLVFLIYYNIGGIGDEIPLLRVAENKNISFLYFPLMILSMLTTCVSSGYSFMLSFEKISKSVKILLLIVVSVIMAAIRFSYLIKYIFGGMGIISFIILCFCIKKS